MAATSYDAFSGAGAAVGDYVAAAASSSAASASSSETATSWLARDSALCAFQQGAPHVLRQMHTSTSLFRCINLDPQSLQQQIQQSYHHQLQPPPLALLNTRLHSGDVLEIFGKTCAGKTEMMYQSILHAIMPKTVVSDHFKGELELGGLDSGAILLDCDFRFSPSRFNQLLESHFTAAANRFIRRRASTRAPIPDLDQRIAKKIDSYFKCDEFAKIRRHCMINFFILNGSTTLDALIALREVEELVRDYAADTKRQTWSSREKQIAASAAAAKQNESNAAASDTEMKVTDTTDPRYNPSLSASSLAATTAAAASASSRASPPHIALLAIDNISAYYWLTRPHQMGKQVIGEGLYSRERQAIGAGATGPEPAGGGLRPAFYELFTHKLRYLLTNYRMIGVVTKSTVFQKHNMQVEKDLYHDEFLGLVWNGLITHRIVIRELPDPQSMTAQSTRRYLPGSVEEARQLDLQREMELLKQQRGVLRGAALKDIKSKQSQTLEFQFRINHQGLQSA